MNDKLNNNINKIMDSIGTENIVVKRKFLIGKPNPVEAAIIFIDGIANKDVLDRAVLNPLMNYINEDLKNISRLPEYILETYIPMANAVTETDIEKAIDNIKKGKTALILQGYDEIIILDTADGKRTRAISEPQNESVLRGARTGFIEDMNVNISLIKSRIKDSGLKVEFSKIGRRSQTDIALVYIKDIADDNIVNDLKKKLSQIDIDCITATGELEQYLGMNNSNIFPQFHGSERIDKAEANIMEGRIAIILDGTPYVLTVPTIFGEFFQAPEDYYQSTLSANFLRLLRFFGAFLVVSLEPFYLTLVKSNNEFIPLEFIIPITQARQGIALSLFIEILSMELIVEFLREGGLRLPSKIAQTMSLVGGIIIGDTAIKAKIVSPTTLFIVGVSTVATFIIVDYNMSIAIRIIKYPVLFLSYYLGIFGISVGWFLLFFYLSTIENFGVPYFTFRKGDLKDIFIRKPLWELTTRPEAIPHKDNIRKSNSGNKIRGNKNE